MPAPSSLAEIVSCVAPLIEAHAIDSSPIEAVGLVFADGTTHRLINQARHEHRFSVSEAQLRDAIAFRKRTPIALYHSHPKSKAVPSSHDRHTMEKQFIAAGRPIPFLIWGIDGLRVWLWQDGPVEAHLEEEPCPMS